MSSDTTSPSFPDVDWDIRRASYIDVCTSPWSGPNPPNPFDYMKSMAPSKVDGFILAFGVVLKKDPTDVILKWGGCDKLLDPQKDPPKGKWLSADLAQGEWEKDYIQKFTKEGGKFAISFGGQANYPLEEHWNAIDKDLKNICKIASTFALQYEKIIKNYMCDHLDFDFEGDFIGHDEALQVHVKTMEKLLQEYSNLKISYTLPVDGVLGKGGFKEDGKHLLELLATAGIQPSLITGMLMVYSSGAPDDWWSATKVALEGMHEQIKTIWSRFKWDDNKVWRRIGACPQYGVSKEDPKRPCTLDYMTELVKYAQDRNIGCISGWSANCDAQGESCTKVEQKPFDFCKKIATYQPKPI